MTDKEHEELQASIKKMEEQNAELFEQLGISSHQLHHFINDPARFSTESKEEIEHQAHELELMLQRHIDETRASLKQQSASTDEKTGGHWILMK
ncbi:MAG: hypothetical protein JWO53_188 [Chlamydiia bacterium]|nr:hypothetical protein [Chlamydiia bacterium]